ncbi:2'-5' RNA ligase family protein [Candidatus Uhrbacteria bacterium]|nr:2'-5' RNA ligase family protein [Candidatus Uhrbacteria bacterium]
MRYFLAHILSGDDAERMQELRREISKRFHVHAALKLPPHITLVRPFESVAMPDFISDAIADAGDLLEPQTIGTRGFAAFGNAVWFLDLEQRKRWFEVKAELEKRLRVTIAWIPEEYDIDVHFHLTLAYKDVEPQTHELIGRFLQTQPIPIKRIQFESYSLLQHDGMRWQEIERFPLGRRSR